MAPEESARLTGELSELRKHALARAAASVSKDLHPETVMLVGDPARVLEREAGEGLDLLVLGSRGYGPVRRVLLGGVSESVVRRSPCPVLVVPRTVEFDPSAGGMAAHDTADPAPLEAR
jgi:nucleotide-binding universal stress UspA family protein